MFDNAQFYDAEGKFDVEKGKDGIEALHKIEQLDPDLLTLRAVKVIQEADVIFCSRSCTSLMTSAGSVFSKE